jgi:hypothetical protein
MKRLMHSQLLIIFLFSSSLLSQQLSQMSVVGKAEFQSSELIAKEIRDANSEICAGLIIATDLDGLKFDSYNGIVKMNADKPGRYFLFLSPDERVVTVYKTGYEPLKLILSEHTIAKMQSGKVWQLKITGEKKLELIPVNIVVEPQVERILVDGKAEEAGKVLQLASGKHTVQIEKKGFKQFEQVIDVSLAKTMFNFKLTEVELISVTIRSVPVGAKIFLNGVEKGETDKGLFLYPGEINLKLVKSGYLDVQQTVGVKEDGQNTLSYNLTRNAGTLSLTILPADARVLINKEEYTNRTNIELPPGMYKIEIIKTGFNSITEIIEITLGKPITKQYTLMAKTGSLQFSVTPVDAQAKLTKDGTEILRWTGMKMQKGIAVGDYELEVTALGYTPSKKRITIVEGKTLAEDLILRGGSSEEINKRASIKTTRAGYEGEYKDGKKNGHGKMIYENGSTYEGEWKDDKIGSNGTVIWANGNKYIGDLVNGQMSGKGTFTTAKGSKHTGNFVNGIIEGEGVYTYKAEDGSINTLTGYFNAGGLINGNSITIFPSGKKYIYDYKNGEIGKAKEQE